MVGAAARWAAVAVGLATAVLGLTGRAGAAGTCPTAALRWASSTNTIAVSGPVQCTIADLAAFRPSVVNQTAPGVYLLSANLRLTDGAHLGVLGPAVGGDVVELRLLSGADRYVQVLADHGTVRVEGVRVTSWDPASDHPDTNVADGRAHIKVRSRVVDGVAKVSRLDVVDSDIGYLGFDGPESYGLSWKVMDLAFAEVDVVGDILRSRIHHNYFGAYTYGAYGMSVDGNTFDHNHSYGFDPHDDSDALVIVNNRFEANGTHGLICSQRCDHLRIEGNVSVDNGGHGIMLHRSVDDSVVANNVVSGNGGAGIALFESNGNVVAGNVISGNDVGIRLSVGASFNLFRANTVTTNRVGVATYQGSDAPVRGDGVNRANHWDANVITASTVVVLQLGASEGDLWSGNDVSDNPGAVFELGSRSNSFTTNRGI